MKIRSIDICQIVDYLRFNTVQDNALKYITFIGWKVWNYGLKKIMCR